MTPKADYLIQVLEKIGLPLLSSLVEVQAGTGDVEEARRMAELLSRTTQASLEIANVLSPSGAIQDDAFRLAMAALAAPVIADHYRYDRQVPGEADIKKIVAAVQTVMTFSDNFEAQSDNARALEAVGGGAAKLPGADHVMLHQILAFTPVINAVGSFSFGQNEPKLIRDIAERLVAQATDLGAQLFMHLNEAGRKAASLDILKTLAQLYAACHQQETARLNTAEAGAGGGLEMVWKNFELRAALLEALASNLAALSGGGTRAPAMSAPPAQETAAPVSPPPQPASPPQQGGFNPMGAFAPKPTQDAPPEPPPPAAETSPMPDNPAQPAQSPAKNPMGFFKATPKKDDE